MMIRSFDPITVLVHYRSSSAAFNPFEPNKPVGVCLIGCVRTISVACLRFLLSIYVSGCSYREA